MSTIKTKKVQVGTDSTASNNFTIYTPGTPDGTVRIGNGNADSPTEIARFDANGLIMASGKSISGNPPQVTVLTSGTGTYTTPTNASYLVIEMCGGGAGGTGSFDGGVTAPGAGTAGGNTTFGSSLLTCNGGSTTGGIYNSGGVGGTATIGAGATGIAITGGGGVAGWAFSSAGYANGGPGGINAFAGQGNGGAAPNSAGNSPSANTGAGGNGCASSGNPGGSQYNSGGGGGAGGYIKATITSPSASYSYAIGAGGTGGTAGTNGGAGAAGAAGIIIVTAYFG